MPDWREVARRKAAKYGLDPDIFVRQIGAESGFNPQARSPAGAQGIAQIMPGTADAWNVNPWKPRHALDAAARNMASYVKQYGSYENALRAYNAGPGAIQASHGYAETNAYVNKILNGSDPKNLSRPSRTGGGNGGGRARPVTLSQTVGFPGAVLSPPDVGVLTGLLAQQEKPRVPVSAPSPVDFGADRYLRSASSGVIPSSGAPVAQRPGGLTEALAGLGSAPSIVVPGGQQTVSVTGRAGGPVGRTLVIGDSLGVGTVPELRQLGVRVKANAEVGRSSREGVRALRQALAGRDYQNIVFDLGTNDGSAQQLRSSLREALRLAPNATFYVPTVNGPGAAAKNRVIKQIARNHANVEIVRWHGATKGGSTLSDGIHGAYDRRASLVAGALGFDPRSTQPAPNTKGPVKLLPGADRAGVPTRPVVKNFLAQVAGLAGQPITISTGSNHKQFSRPGVTSDHWVGFGADLGSVSNGFEVGGSGGDKIAAAAIRAATGMSASQAMKLARAGGIHNFNPTSGRWKGRDIQIIWRAADHYDHVHVGIK